MRRTLRLVIAIAVSALVAALVPVEPADAKTRQTVSKAGNKAGTKISKKRGSGRNYGPYGFLPGVRSPEAIELERSARRGSGYNWYAYSPYYGYAPVGVATFYHGRWNGGSFGPCWTRTPAGMIWNCGR